MGNARSRSFVALLTMAAVSLMVSPARARPAQSDPRPNILLIVLDAVGADKLALFDVGGSTIHPKTPHLDALSALGIRFQRCYANPKCSTSRACIQTGRYAYHTGVGDVLNSVF